MPRRTAQSDQHVAPKGLTVFERRLANPLGKRSRGIPLADRLQHWTVRVFTQDPEHQDRHYEAVHELGYRPCTPDDFDVDVRALGLTVSPEGFVVRGAKGQDMIMRIPTKQYTAIQRAKANANLASVGKQKLREELADVAAKAHGDAAGETIHKTYEQTEIVAPVEVA